MSTALNPIDLQKALHGVELWHRAGEVDGAQPGLGGDERELADRGV